MGRTPSPPRGGNGGTAISTPEIDPDEQQPGNEAAAVRLEEGATNSAPNSLWSSLISSTLGVGAKAGTIQWAAPLRRAMVSGPVRRLHDCILGLRATNGLSPGAAIWLLGICYKSPSGEEQAQAESTSPEAEFLLDFSSRIWITYRQGFPAISHSSLTTDAGWGCMIRSGQMLVAQALVSHRLGRNWRRGEKPYSREYLEVLASFGDSPQSCFSIHNLIAAGAPYGLAAGSWIGPYALCHAIEALARRGGGGEGEGEGGGEGEGDGEGGGGGDEAATRNKDPESGRMSVYVVSGEADGERGGAPVLCIDDVAGLSPVLILVPLVLGLDKINPRYLPSLRATFTFPQSVGIAGGKPGASVYLVGVQDDQALYLDPHLVQKVVRISTENPDVDTSSYHCSAVRHMPLDAIDPSLALGFYCKTRDEFDDFCERATELASQSNGAPMFTIAKNTSKLRKPEATSELQQQGGYEEHKRGEVSIEALNLSEETLTEEDWQIL